MSWDNLDSSLSAFFAAYGVAKNERASAASDLSSAKADFGNVSGIDIWLYRTIEHMLDVQTHIVDCLESLITYDQTEPTWYVLNAIFYYQDQKYLSALTWESIIEAWVAADLDGIKFTVSILDYMREALWNEPYDAKFFKPATDSCFRSGFHAAIYSSQRDIMSN